MEMNPLSRNNQGSGIVKSEEWRVNSAASRDTIRDYANPLGPDRALALSANNHLGDWQNQDRQLSRCDTWLENSFGYHYTARIRFRRRRRDDTTIFSLFTYVTDTMNDCFLWDINFFFFFSFDVLRFKEESDAEMHRNVRVAVGYARATGVCEKDDLNLNKRDKAAIKYN